MNDRIDNFTQMGCAGALSHTRVEFTMFADSFSTSQLYPAPACAGFLNVGWGEDPIMATQFCAGGLHKENNFTKSPDFI